MRLVLVSLALVATACGSHDSPPPATMPAPAVPAPAPPAPPPEPARAPLEIHEWGLIDHSLATGQLELATGPGTPAVPMVARKPVLYAHLIDGAESATLDVLVRVPTGALLEHWPASSELTEHTLAWRAATITRGACAAEVARDLGTQREAAAPCAAPDGFCEVAELPRYRTDDHDCIRVGDVAAPLLFYRATAQPSTLPIDVTVRPDRALALRARRSLAGAPEAIFRITSSPLGRLVARAPLPGVEQSLTIGPATERLDPQAAQSAMRDDLRALGLTTSEADAFLGAWADELFGAIAPTGRTARRGVVATRPVDILIYWLPPDAIPAIAELEITPTPTAIRRAFLVRVDLGA
jgi:hypothetical protein